MKNKNILLISVLLILAIVGAYFGGLFSVLDSPDGGTYYTIAFLDSQGMDDYGAVGGPIVQGDGIDSTTIHPFGIPTNVVYKSFSEFTYTYPGPTVGSWTESQTITRQYSQSSFKITIDGVTKTIYEGYGQAYFDQYQCSDSDYNEDHESFLYPKDSGIYFSSDYIGSTTSTDPELRIADAIPQEAYFMDNQLKVTALRGYTSDCNMNGDGWTNFDIYGRIRVDVYPEVSIKSIDFTDAFDETITDKKLYVTIENNFTEFTGRIALTNNIKQLSGIYTTRENYENRTIMEGTNRYAFGIDLIDVGAETVDVSLDYIFINPYQYVGWYDSTLTPGTTCKHRIAEKDDYGEYRCFDDFIGSKRVANYTSPSLIGILTEDLDAKIALVQELEGNIDEQVNLINNLSVTLEEKAEIVSGLNATIEEQALMIKALSSTTDEQTLYIAQLDATIQEKAEIINQLEMTLEEQTATISQLTAKAEEQAQYIESLTINIQEQADMINLLTQNLEEKAYLVSQLEAENDKQAQLIAEMEESFANQGIIIDSLNKEIQDDAQIIGNLTTKVEEQAEIIKGMEVNLDEQAELIKTLQSQNDQQAIMIQQLTNLTEEQGRIIAELELSLEESANIIRGLNIELDNQASLIKTLRLTNEQEKELVAELTEKVEEQELIIDELKREHLKDYITLGLIVLGGLISIGFALMWWFKWRRK